MAKEKLERPRLLRLTAKMDDRLQRIADERDEEPLEIVRRGLITELDRLDAQMPDKTRAEVIRLAEAGLDLTTIINDALERKKAEDAQMTMPAIAAPAGGR